MSWVDTCRAEGQDSPGQLLAKKFTEPRIVVDGTKIRLENPAQRSDGAKPPGFVHASAGARRLIIRQSGPNLSDW
jgi:hypothetical protein